MKALVRRARSPGRLPQPRVCSPLQHSFASPHQFVVPEKAPPLNPSIDTLFSAVSSASGVYWWASWITVDICSPPPVPHANTHLTRLCDAVPLQETRPCGLAPLKNASYHLFDKPSHADSPHGCFPVADATGGIIRKHIFTQFQQVHSHLVRDNPIFRINLPAHLHIQHKGRASNAADAGERAH